MATSTEGVKPTKRRKRSEVEESPIAENPQSDQKPEPAAADAEPEVQPEKKKRKKKKTVTVDAIAINADSEENPVVDSSKSIEIKPEFLAAAESKPEIVAEAIIETVPSKKKKQKKSTSEDNRSEIEDGVQKPEITAVDGGGLVPETKNRKKKKKKTVAEDSMAANVDSEVSPVVDSSKYIEIKQAEVLGKPEVFATATAGEAEATFETVPSKKKKQKKSAAEEGVNAENPELVPNQQLDHGGGVVPETKRRKKKKTVAAEDSITSTTNADSEGNPVVDASKSIDIEQAQLIQEPEVSAVAEAKPELGVEAGAKTVPGKKKKKRKKKKQQRSPEGVKGTEGGKGSEMENGVNEENKKKKNKKNKKKKKKKKEDPISIDDWQKYVKIKEAQLLGKPELVAVAQQVEGRRYVEICVICRKKGHSIPTCPEVNDDLKRKRKSASSMTLKRQRKRQRIAEKKSSQFPQPPREETKASPEDENTSLVTCCAVQDHTMADETCAAREDVSVVKAGKEEEPVVKAGKEDESVAIAGKENESVAIAGKEEESVARADKEDESVAIAGKEDEPVVMAGKEDESVAIAGKEDVFVAKADSASHSQKGRVKKSKTKQDPGVVISVA